MGAFDRVIELGVCWPIAGHDQWVGKQFSPSPATSMKVLTKTILRSHFMLQGARPGRRQQGAVAGGSAPVPAAGAL